MTKKNAFLKFLMQMSFAVLILSSICFLNIKTNQPEYYALVFTMVINIILIIAIIAVINRNSAKKNKN